MSLNLTAVSFDCGDAASLAGFWAAALERVVDEGASEDFASIGFAAGGGEPPHWLFSKVPEGKAAKNRVHPDLFAGDLPSEVKRLVGLGATEQAEHEHSGFHWVTLHDPEGNEFDVVVASAG